MRHVAMAMVAVRNTTAEEEPPTNDNSGLGPDDASARGFCDLYSESFQGTVCVSP